MTSTPLGQFLLAMPKMELHCHLLGTVRKATFEDLVRQVKAPLAAEEVAAFYTRGEKPVGVLRVLRALDQWLLTKPDDFYRITYEYLQDCAAHQVRYSEFFWNPTGTAQVSGLAYAQVVSAICSAMAAAEEDFGIRSGLIPAIDREASPRAAVEMVQWIIEHRQVRAHSAHAQRVLGIGMDYRENDRPPELFVEAYALARRHGLKTTAHAGEFGLPWHNVETAIEVLKVDRIDHGYTAIDNPFLIQKAIERGILFTVVPTNSYYLRTLPPERWAQDHPIRQMPGLGLRIHPNTDDPTLHHINPTGAWHMMVRDFGFGLDELRGFMQNGLDGAWIEPAQRRAWQSSWLAEFDVLRLQHGL
jgi:adenosine deaminase